MESNEDRVLRYLVDCAGLSDIDERTRGAQFDDLDVDSLARLELVSRLQDETGLPIDDSDVGAHSTPASVAALLDQLSATAASGADATSGDRDLEPTTDAQILIRLPLEEVWSSTNDLLSWPTLFSEYQCVEILSQVDDTVRFRLTMKPDDDGNVWSWVSERTADPANHTVSARRIETGWFTHMHIRWDYHQTDTGTVLRWRQWFDMREDSPVSQQSMTTRIRANTAIQLDHIRTTLESGRVTPAGMV